MAKYHRQISWITFTVIALCQLLLDVHGQTYQQGKSWNAEHRFVEGDAYLEIDKSYFGGNYTTYEFKVGPMKEGNRLRVAIQWIRENGEVYDAIMFICKVKKRYEDRQPIIEYYQAGDFISNIADTPPEERNKTYFGFLKDFMGGEHISSKRPEVTVVEQKLDSGVSSANRFLTIKWRRVGHEPQGLNRMWWAYIQYESGVSCKKIGNCFTEENIVARQEGYNYYNVLTFADINLISRDQLMLIYWTIFVFSNFWIFGMPAQILLTLYVNFCFGFNILYNYQVTLEADHYSDTQTEVFSFWNWIWESVFYWGFGTFFTTWTMIFVTLIPIFGPTMILLMICYNLLTMFN